MLYPIMQAGVIHVILTMTQRMFRTCLGRCDLVCMQVLHAAKPMLQLINALLFPDSEVTETG